jgi:hypothetical protein
MADHTENAMLAAARAMQEVVLPAIDPAHPLAREQAGLVLKFLQLWQGRLDFMYDRNRFELREYVSLARELRAGPLPRSPSILEALDDAIARGMELVERPGARASDLQAAAQRTAGVISALLRTALDIADPCLPRIEAAVLTRAKRLLDAQRAWFLPQGWEPDSRDIPALEVAFAPDQGRTGG